MAFSIIVHTTPKKVNQSLNYHHKIPVIHTGGYGGHRGVTKSQEATKEKVRIAEMLENLHDTPPINTRIKKPLNILPP